MWHRKMRNDYYYSNSTIEKSRVKNRKRNLSDWLFGLKQDKKCIICGFDHPAALDFHHRDKASKSFNISKAPMYGWSKQRILEEISKCDVLCANCHRIHHFDEIIADVS